MEAYRVERLGGIEALTRTDVPLPEPGLGQIRIAVRAAGLHLADAAVLSGQRQPRLQPPLIPGFEVSGTVEAVGGDVSGFEPGQNVIAFLRSGGLAEAAIAEAALTVPLPEGLIFARAAGLPLAYAGGLMALRDRAGLASGERLAVLGAGGQTGLAAIDLGKRLGAEVLAVAGQAARLETARQLGADHAIDASAGPVGEAIGEATGGHGVDVVFDPVGGDGPAAVLPALAMGGRVVSVGFASGRAPALAIPALHARDGVLLTTNLALMIARQPERARAALEEVAGWTVAGEIRPRIAAQFGFDEVRQAFDYVMARRDAGSVVIAMAAD